MCSQKDEWKKLDMGVSLLLSSCLFYRSFLSPSWTQKTFALLSPRGNFVRQQYSVQDRALTLKRSWSWVARVPLFWKRRSSQTDWLMQGGRERGRARERELPRLSLSGRSVLYICSSYLAEQHWDAVHSPAGKYQSCHTLRPQHWR